MNDFALQGEPFLFVIDFKGENGYCIHKNKIDANYIRTTLIGDKRFKKKSNHKPFTWSVHPVSKSDYSKRFASVKNEIQLGNSFLVNLTQPTQVSSNFNLNELYACGNARYKLLLTNKFACFSPEIFLQIRGNKIASYPMKGTIDANMPDAKTQILNDEKEKAEHATIVDLIRNDLSMVAFDVHVERYRYVEKLLTNNTDLLQVSSEISGTIQANYMGRIGDIVFAMLPAGSISGAPKAKTMEIIEQAEGYERGFYTGVFGYFDGKNMDAAVMIRFIEQQNNNLVFKSGGGITFKSELDKEYEELIQKVYVPIY
ncbi:MAG: aminodeoxychorismate synthase component I [Porphyromonadaceae bacterium CG2_30_38_12]|nr:MAG: aminodeoxychorismate synthase component I [Porphyromonadaceae bacterium CG2_30_38_12]